MEVFSSGGGTQSACISAMIVLGELPKPDLVVIADTGYECASTWQYLDDVVRPALASVGVQVHRIGPEWKSMPDHGMDWMSHNMETMLLPAFTNQSGEVGKVKRVLLQNLEGGGCEPLPLPAVRANPQQVPQVDRVQP